MWEDNPKTIFRTGAEPQKPWMLIFFVPNSTKPHSFKDNDRAEISNYTMSLLMNSLIIADIFTCRKTELTLTINYKDIIGTYQ